MPATEVRTPARCGHPGCDEPTDTVVLFVRATGVCGLTYCLGHAQDFIIHAATFDGVDLVREQVAR